MPLREFGCVACGNTKEVFHPSLTPELVPAPTCPPCNTPMALLWSTPNIDTSDTFHPFTYKGPTGIVHEITNLHSLRRVEHLYQETGHNIRFDAYSAEPSNPDTVDGFGPEYWDGSPSFTNRKTFGLPTM